MQCQEYAQTGAMEKDKCHIAGCKGVVIETGDIIALGFRQLKDRVIEGKVHEAWDILCRACLMHELFGHTVYHDSPEVRVITPSDKDLEWWGDDRVISCSICANILVDDGIADEDPQ